MDKGLVLMYVQDGELYPVAMTENQYQMLQMLAPAIFGDNPIKVINQSQGKITNLAEGK